MREITPELIRAMAGEYAFKGPVVQNNFRSVVVEAMVAAALPDWTWCSADWGAWDLEKAPGLR